MKSASHMSMLIRAKKKLMQEDPDVIDSGGSPKMDLQDIENHRLEEATDAMDENIPKEHSEGHDLSPAAESAEEKLAQSNHEDDKHYANSEDPEYMAAMKRKMRISKMMSK